MKNFFLIVGKNGTFVPEDGRSVTDVINDIYSKPNDVDALFDFLESKGIKKLAIHIHGGLVSQASGIEAAQNMAKTFSKANSFPIALIWKTGILEVARQVIFDTQTTTLFNELKRIVIKRVMDRIGDDDSGKGINNSPRSIDDELAKEEPFENFKPVGGAKGGISSDPDSQVFTDELSILLEEDIEGLSSLLLIDNENDIYLDKDKISDVGNEGAKGVISVKFVIALTKIVVRIVKRFRSGKDHGLYCTSIEEIYRELYISKIGTIIWDEIKEKAENMFNTNTGVSGIQAHVGTHFLSRLNQYAEKHRDLIVDIVGHSAGAIVSSHLFKSINTSFNFIKIRKVIFLAPACRSELFNDFITVPCYKDFYLFTMSDEYEKKDRLVSVLYPHSLLYFVSGLLEGKPDAAVLGMERHFDSIAGHRDFLTKNGIMSITVEGSLDGKRSFSRKHGDFDNDTQTLESIYHIIK